MRVEKSRVWRKPIKITSRTTRWKRSRGGADLARHLAPVIPRPITPRPVMARPIMARPIMARVVAALVGTAPVVRSVGGGRRAFQFLAALLQGLLDQAAPPARPTWLARRKASSSIS
jgi:hypothetical protein